MSFFVVFLFLFIQSNAYTDIIDTTEPNEYSHQPLTCSGNGDCQIICDEAHSCFDTTITCPQHFLCDITCSGSHSCELAHITCPYGDSCTVHCNNDHSCQRTTIYAQYSSQFKLNDCSTGDLSCNGMTIYFPPNDDGPRSVIDGGNHLSSLHDEPLHFYAIFGWHDIHFIHYEGQFEDNSNAYMHCLPDYSQTCPLALDSWSCAQPNHTCNAPPTQPPTASPTVSPTFQPTRATQEPTMHPTQEPTATPTSVPTSTPTLYPTVQTTKRPTSQPTQPTSEPTMDPTLEPTSERVVVTIAFSTERTILNSMFDDDESTASATESMDWLWVVTALLVVVLCFILIVLSYFIYPARSKSSKPEHAHAVNQGQSDDINKLILSALNENRNNKYDVPPPPDAESQDCAVNEGYNAIPNGGPLSLKPKSSLHVHHNPLWSDKKNNRAPKAGIQAVSLPCAPNHNIYPNGKLTQLHAQSFSQPAGYHYCDDSHSLPHRSINSNSNQSAAAGYFNYLHPSSEPVECALNHHLHEQQVSESLFNRQQQRLQHTSKHALMVIDDGKSTSKPYMQLRVNAALPHDAEIHRKKSTFSVELAASKLLSPLSTATPSSVVVSDRSVSDDEEPLLLVTQPRDEDTGFPVTTGTNTPNSNDSSSSNACSSSCSGSASTSTSCSEDYAAEVELKRETESPNSMDSTDDDLMHLMVSMDEQEAEEDEEDEIGVHARNATVIVKESISHDALDAIPSRTPRISITIGHSAELFESPFNEDDKDKTVWTQTDNHKLKDVKRPMSIRSNKEEDGSKGVHDINGVRSPTLEIQGLISV